ncbi:MAG: hypothetical protein KBA40_01690 [Candidatus Peribacteraceae bacterium]|nr:hypothetical protein [Candidatus Peribacteraceae bacterium]MBP9850166.1 hypothetical protein [Candidatus Peribacteraceae bacterium]
MNLGRQNRADLEKLQAIFQRPLTCPGGKPMRHEEVRRDDNGLPIYYGQNGVKYRFEDECPNKHARCPHHDEELWKRVRWALEDLLEDILIDEELELWREGLTMLEKWQKGEIGKRMVTLDDELRIARTGAEREELLCAEGIPSITQAYEQAAPLEDEWRTLIEESEGGRRKILAMLNAAVA